MDKKTKKEQMTKDGLLVDNIKNQLEAEMQASSMDINVASINGAIQLSGIVDVLAEKKFAEKVTQNIRGVKRVKNNITIAMDSNFTDKHMEKEIRGKLRDNPNSDRILGVGIKVNDGVADLVGHVDTISDAHVAMDLASQARGIKDVVNNIVVDTVGNFDDVSISNVIVQQLKLEDLTYRKLACDVYGGVVTLSGVVNNKNEVEIAKEIAMSVDGVKRVINNLKTRK